MKNENVLKSKRFVVRKYLIGKNKIITLMGFMNIAVT